MQTSDRAASRPRDLRHARRTVRPGRRSRAWLSGGNEGNERLTTATGMILIVLLAVIGVTILRIGQLISVHLFVGLLLIGPVALKMASTGYRFMRYYTGDAVYRRKGPPELILRAIGPIVVLSTVGVLVSGVILMLQGRAHRDPMLLIHKLSFIAWIVFTAVHVLGHVPELVSYIPGLRRSSRAQEVRQTLLDLRGTSHLDPQRELPTEPVAGGAGRSIALIGALVAGLILAIVLIPHYGVWTHHLAGFGGDH